MKFGHWTPLYTPPSGRHAKVSCRCVCGVVREVRVDDLKSGGSVSCGCRSTKNAQKHSDADALAMLAAYKQKYGHANPPRTVDEDEFKYLAKWLIYKRVQYRSGTLPASLKRKLVAAGVVFSPLDRTREEFFDYVKKNGDLPSRKDKDPAVARLGAWLHRARQKLRAGESDRQLEALLRKYTRRLNGWFR